LKDPAGNQIILYHGGENRKYPPWRLKDWFCAKSILQKGVSLPGCNTSPDPAQWNGLNTKQIGNVFIRRPDDHIGKVIYVLLIPLPLLLSRLYEKKENLFSHNIVPLIRAILNMHDIRRTQ
jgi:hypothetical protein